jgi:Helicase associated domain
MARRMSCRSPIWLLTFRLLYFVLVSLVKDLTCEAFSDSSLLSTLRLTSRLGATSGEAHHIHFTSAEGALQSPGLARHIRKNRANRGRPPAEITKRHGPIKRATSRAISRSDKSKRVNGIDMPYESAIQVLCAFHSIHSHLVIPRRFVVPHEPEYPTAWHGVELSKTVYNMKWWQLHVKQNPNRVAELNKLGFIWERLLPEWNLVLEALITFSALNGHLLVPTKFLVPHDSEHYPKATWGLPLGKCVFRIRTRNDFLRGNNAASRRAQLDGLGFVWDVTEHLFQKFFTALRLFQKLEQGWSEEGGTRALRVPSTFVVPSQEGNGWPRELWGYRLGEKCAAVRQKQLYVKNYPERQRALAELGFQWSGNTTLGWLEVVHAAAIYSKMHNRNLDVPYHFVVPASPHIDHDRSDEKKVSSITGSDDAWPWPGKNTCVRYTSFNSCGPFL